MTIRTYEYVDKERNRKIIQAHSEEEALERMRKSCGEDWKSKWTWVREQEDWKR